MVIFLVDALDQCSEEQQYGKFLKLITTIMVRENVWFLCSSGQHVPVQRLLRKLKLYDIDVQLRVRKQT